jgi:tRNA (guanine37-N1)-methyltransferase
VLLSGHHARIQAWRRRESIKVTAQARPEILKNIELTQEERALVARLTQQENNDELA